VNIIKLNAITSTNSYLKDLVRASHLEDGTIVVTANQISGRGQRGAIWHAQKDKSLTFSVFKKFDALYSERKFDLSMVVSLALIRVLKEYKVPSVSVKWPNDIMSAQKKCAGILIENQLESNRVAHSVIGIGLNVNETKLDGLPQATSLLKQTGRTFDLDALLLAISSAIVNDLLHLERMSSLGIHTDYEAQLFRKDMISVFEDCHKKRSNGIIRGVTSTGLLRVEHDADLFPTYDLKQVKLCY